MEDISRAEDYAKVLSVYAKIKAIEIGVEGMKAANTQRAINNESLAYTEQSFIEAANMLHELSDVLK